MQSTYPDSSMPGVISVTELNRQAKSLLERNIPLCWIAGEISNLTRAPSGHWYFSLKDQGAQVRCAMFRHKNQYLDWRPENGAQVEVRALATLYEARGEFQLSVESMRRSGLGTLYEAFEKLKFKLEQEGLFLASGKKPLPLFPRCLGIVTSPAAAALRDVLSTLQRRMPSLPVILYPTPVQGDGAAEKIATMLRTAGQRQECDVLLLCRGGGSIEDLWQFNQEIVARAIHACPIPIICGVGHETDFTIADFSADLRAPTPTAAAELATPNRRELAHRLYGLANRLEQGATRSLEQRMLHLDHLARRLVHPGTRLQVQASRLQHLHQRLADYWSRSLEQRRWRLEHASQRLLAQRPDGYRLAQQCITLQRRLDQSLAHGLERRQVSLRQLQASLSHLNPLAVLERGYSIVENESGEIVRDSQSLSLDETISLTFARGRVRAQVSEKN
ncbi:MAG: exodeoxyribonuclease VII large subunit [Sulfuricellaceae bacterium]|nr:exodeoxyribonuclease VII large subunit [Sulfuricellaceae bacterium]